MELPSPCGLVTLLTDFGLRDPYVGIMKGAVVVQNARAEIVDLCHEVPAHGVAVGALFLAAAARHFPPGTVHVAVVDPGVGTARRALAACAHGSYWLAPDNGLLGAVLAAAGSACELRALDLAALGLVPASPTFHGRDVFAPLAGALSARRCGFRALGPRIDDPVALSRPIGACVVAVDHFGNLITDVRGSEVASRRITAVVIKGRRVGLRLTYGEVPAGTPLALVNSYDLLEIAVCQGRADEAFAAGPGEPVQLCVETPP